MSSKPRAGENDGEAGVVLSATSVWGPFARGATPLARAKAIVRNAGADALEATAACVSPLVD